MSKLIKELLFEETPIKVFEGDIPTNILSDLLSSKIIAVDLEYKTSEMNNFYVPTINLALIQIYSESVGSVIIRVGNMAPENLKKLLSDDSIKKVFHHAFQDCSILYHHWGVLLKNIACTKEAAKLYNMDKEKSSSLREILKIVLKIDIPKTERTSDWLAESLTDDQLIYAARDTIYLFNLYHKLEEMLAKKGQEWLEAAHLNWAAIPSQVFNNTKGVHEIYGELYNY